MRNLRGKGFEAYPPLFGTAARTGFLTFVAVDPQYPQMLPMGFNMEYRHIRTLIAAFTRLSVCSLDDDGLFGLNPSFELYDSLRDYLAALNALTGEWRPRSTRYIEEGNCLSADTVFALLGGKIRTLVLLAASVSPVDSDSLAKRLNCSPGDISTVISFYVRSGILAHSRGEVTFALKGNTTTPALTTFLEQCSRIVTRTTG